MKKYVKELAVKTFKIVFSVKGVNPILKLGVTPVKLVLN
jgi:hypothetical protein